MFPVYEDPVIAIAGIYFIYSYFFFLHIQYDIISIVWFYAFNFKLIIQSACSCKQVKKEKKIKSFVAVVAVKSLYILMEVNFPKYTLMGFFYFSLSDPSETASCKQNNNCDFRKSGESFFIWITWRFSSTSWESKFRKSLHYSKRYLKNLGCRNVFTTVQFYCNIWQTGNRRKS